MSVYPKITDALVADTHSDDLGIYDAARGDEDAQIWMARLFAAKAEAAADQSSRLAGTIVAAVYSGLAAVHGRVEAVALYRDCLARHRALAEYNPTAAAGQDKLIADLSNAVSGKAHTDRVEVRV